MSNCEFTKELRNPRNKNAENTTGTNANCQEEYQSDPKTFLIFVLVMTSFITLGSIFYKIYRRKSMNMRVIPAQCLENQVKTYPHSRSKVSEESNK